MGQCMMNKWLDHCMLVCMDNRMCWRVSRLRVDCVGNWVSCVSCWMNCVCKWMGCLVSRVAKNAVMTQVLSWVDCNSISLMVDTVVM